MNMKENVVIILLIVHGLLHVRKKNTILYSMLTHLPKKRLKYLLMMCILKRIMILTMMK